MQRYFIDELDIEKKSALLTDNDFHHIKNVMRHKIDDHIIVCNKQGVCYESSITHFEDKQVVVKLIEEKLSNDLPLQVTIAQAVIRRERFEYMIQKSSELGVTSIIPTLMKNVIIKLDQKKMNKKVERWNILAKEACEQSHRNQLAKVQNITQLKLIDLSTYDKVIVAYEKKNQSTNLKKVLKDKPQNILAIIGPEGGFTPKEIAYLEEFSNVSLVGLGRRILRSETASSYLLSVLSYEYEMK